VKLTNKFSQKLIRLCSN